MTVVVEIAEALKLVGDVVKSTREIIDAINDGRKYLKRYHPAAAPLFGELLEQMQSAIEGLVSVTALVSDFRFVVSGDSLDLDAAKRDLRDLRAYLMRQSKDIVALNGRIRTLKADCEKVRSLRDDLDRQSKSRSWVSLLGLNKKLNAQSQRLWSAVSEFYADDQRMIDALAQLLKLAENAVADVKTALGPAATMNPYNVPLAATALGTYATMFATPTRELQDLADKLSEARTKLSH